LYLRRGFRKWQIAPYSIPDMVRPTRFVEYVCEQLSPTGQVSCRPMFGGWGLSIDGQFCAIVHRDTLYLKTDPVTRKDFESRGCTPFKPFAARETVLSYHEAPAEVFENPGEMLAWGRKALDAALRAGKKPRGTKSSNRRPTRNRVA
jgi:DNA transformation protein and related proteins